MIEAKGITKKFGAYTALEKLDLQVSGSSIYGLIGYNGAGKTTLLKTLAGVYRPDEGRVTVDGAPVYENEAVKRTIFFVPDELFFLPYSTLAGMVKFYRSFYPKFSAVTFEKLAAVFGLDPHKRLQGFSKGMQRQAELILALSCRPDILLLDESFDGLDPAKRSLSKNLLLEYMAEQAVSIVVSSHNLHEVTGLCDHIGLIKGAHLLVDAATADLEGSRYKVRMAFREPKSPGDFEGMELRGWTQEGKVITATLCGKTDAALDAIRAMQPVLFDAIPMTAEEIFLEEMEEETHEIGSIFCDQ